MTSRLQSGLYILQAAICDSLDRIMGQLTTPDAPVNGTVYSPYVVAAPVQYTAAEDTIERSTSFAGQRIRGQREQGISQLGVGTLELAEFDSVFDALVMSYALDTSSSTALEIAGHNANRSLSRRLMLAFTPAATPANGGVNYDTICTWGSLRRGALGTNQGSGKNPNNRSYILTKVLSQRTPWGQLFSQSTINPNGGSDDEVTIYADAPIMFVSYVRDGTASAVSLPFSAEYATAASGLAYKDGTASAQAVAVLTGASLKLGNVGTSGERWVFAFPSVHLLTS